MRKLRIAVAGAGLIGRRHAGLIRQSGSCELVREAGVPIHRSLAALFAGERPDGIIVATPNRLQTERP